MSAWFGRKKYGWGWGPTSWQGWLILAVYVVLVPLIGKFFLPDTARGFYFVAVGVATIALMAIGVMKSGPSQRR
jgi:hypothetical protein